MIETMIQIWFAAGMLLAGYSLRLIVEAVVAYREAEARRSALVQRLIKLEAERMKLYESDRN